ncbi:MAG: DNA modification methylase [uncultured Sphingosinicella sp.]|uniref:DNA modification methylase n=1 Tax=uncultured Sphingosinicella sp. TaxID=478748 RepID=A0A6J4U7D0_9SPHN|nr:DNA methyltransferase [uncultured Sphingosinicella sp.]CAA9542844.1 MAG: DNA modification methylase [uncultured Sphingosinicella sp.]
MSEAAVRHRKRGTRTTAQLFLDQVRAFDEFGARTREEVAGGIPYLVNEYWTAGQRQAHSIHEVSYRACFKPQLPEFFISRLSDPDEGVYDPFMGRGTTPVQAALMGRRPIGSDINPLSVLLTRPRLRAPALGDVAAALERVPWERRPDVREDLLAFYHPETLREVTVLRDWLLDEAPLSRGDPDPAADWVRMVALNRLTGHSPGFFSVYTLPPNQAVSVEAQRKINVRRAQVPTRRNVAELILKKSKALLADGAPTHSSKAILATAPAHRSPSVPDAAAALVITSPPFLDVVQYDDDNWLRCWFAGIDLGAVEIAMHKGEAAWGRMVRDVLEEQARIVRPGGHVAFEVGEVRGGRVLLERLVWKAAAGLPFKRLAVMVNSQEFTKTANCWGISNNKSGTNSNRIVLLQRH